MDTKQVNDALDKLFQGERIVFWNDPDREFVGYLTGQLFSPIEGVKVIRLDQTGALEAKLLIERGEPDSKFLIYAPDDEPEYENDWLLDIRLYSRSFRADRASIILEELGLPNPAPSGPSRPAAEVLRQQGTASEAQVARLARRHR